MDDVHLVLSRGVLVPERSADDLVDRVEVVGVFRSDVHRSSLPGCTRPRGSRWTPGVLDRSYAAAGPHLLSIHNEPGWRLSAEQISERLTGMVLLNLATVNSRGEPLVGPVDGMFFRGRFCCGSSKDSLRAKHIRHNRAVSASHTVGEGLAVIVHGTALDIDKSSELGLGLRDLAGSIYGMDGIDEFWFTDAPYWEIEPRRMFALAPVIPS